MIAWPVDLEAGPRAAAYRHFIVMRQPRWSVCTRVDVAALMQRLPAWREQLPGLTAFVAYHHAILRAANGVTELRQRLVEGGGVLQWSAVDAAPTVLRADGETFGGSHLRYAERLQDFAPAALAEVARAAQVQPGLGFEPVTGATLHMTTLPMIAFTQMNHARSGGFDDGTPALACGRFQAEGERLWMPLAVEVHHALADGLHVGRFLQALEVLLAAPDQLLTTA